MTVGVSRDSPILGVHPIIAGTGKQTDFKFGRYIDRVYVNKKLSYRRETARQLHTTTWAGQLTF